jgi:hypothetical protein
VGSSVTVAIPAASVTSSDGGLVLALLTGTAL